MRTSFFTAALACMCLAAAHFTLDTLDTHDGSNALATIEETAAPTLVTPATAHTDIDFRVASSRAASTHGAVLDLDPARVVERPEVRSGGCESNVGSVQGHFESVQACFERVDSMPRLDASRHRLVRRRLAEKDVHRTLDVFQRPAPAEVTDHTIFSRGQA